MNNNYSSNFTLDQTINQNSLPHSNFDTMIGAFNPGAEKKVSGGSPVISKSFEIELNEKNTSKNYTTIQNSNF